MHKADVLGVIMSLSVAGHLTVVDTVNSRKSEFLLVQATDNGTSMLKCLYEHKLFDMQEFTSDEYAMDYIAKNGTSMDKVPIEITKGGEY